MVHVRARRGQATDSHSLAERVCIYKNINKKKEKDMNILNNFGYFSYQFDCDKGGLIYICMSFIVVQVRRGKINEKLRCLQNIVPGCYKVETCFL